MAERKCTFREESNLTAPPPSEPLRTRSLAGLYTADVDDAVLVRGAGSVLGKHRHRRAVLLSVQRRPRQRRRARRAQAVDSERQVALPEVWLDLPGSVDDPPRGPEEHRYVLVDDIKA